MGDDSQKRSNFKNMKFKGVNLGSEMAMLRLVMPQGRRRVEWRSTTAGVESEF